MENSSINDLYGDAVVALGGTVKERGRGMWR